MSSPNISEQMPPTRALSLAKTEYPNQTTVIRVYVLPIGQFNDSQRSLENHIFSESKIIHSMSRIKKEGGGRGGGGGGRT